MKTIDIHAHLVPRSLWNAVDARTEWHGFRADYGCPSSAKFQNNPVIICKPSRMIEPSACWLR